MKIRLFLFCFHSLKNRLDSAADLMSLHIGDRILEVNGRPVQDYCIEDIENLIASSQDVLQVSMLFLVYCMQCG